MSMDSAAVPSSVVRSHKVYIGLRKIPGVNHLQAVRALEKAGFKIVGLGKHIVMSHGHISSRKAGDETSLPNSGA